MRLSTGSIDTVFFGTLPVRRVIKKIKKYGADLVMGFGHNEVVFAIDHDRGFRVSFADAKNAFLE